MCLKVHKLAEHVDQHVGQLMTYEREIDLLIAIKERPGIAGKKLLTEEFPNTSQPLKALERRMQNLCAKIINAQGHYKIQRLVDTVYLGGDSAITVRTPITLESICTDLERMLPDILNRGFSPEVLVERYKAMSDRLQKRRSAYLDFRAPQENLEYLEEIITPLAQTVFDNPAALCIGVERFNEFDKEILAELCAHKSLHFDFRRLYRYPPPRQLYLPAP
jgi:hypothetical protein